MAVKILIPYNFTPNDTKALDFVGQRYKKSFVERITLFHAHMQIPVIDDTQSPIMKKVAYNTAYLRQQQKEQLNALEDAKEKLVSYGYDPECIQCVFTPVRQDVATDIIRLKEKDNYDVVVLNRSPGSIVNFFTRSVSNRVLRQCGADALIVN